MIKKLLQRNNHFSMTAGVLLCALAVSACSKEQPVAPAAVPAPAQKTAAVTPKAVQAQASSASRIVAASQANQFDFSNKKDPFKPFVAVKVESKKSLDSIKKTQRDSLPIHNVDVNQFKLIGIVTGGRENQAMVTDPDGKGYVLKVGMTIGKNNGRVVSINSGGVDILELFRDDSGKSRRETIKLTLPRKQ